MSERPPNMEFFLIIIDVFVAHCNCWSGMIYWSADRGLLVRGICTSIQSFTRFGIDALL